MKISDIQNQIEYIKNITHQTKEPGISASKEKEKLLSKDNVVLSSRSKEMQKIYETLKETPEVRSDKVAALKKAIQEGKYKVDSQQLAEKILTESILDLIL